MFRTQVNLTKDPILKSMLLFALPMLLSNIFQQLYNTIDIMVVGNYLGDSSLAAIGACSAVYELLTGFAFGVGNGLAIVNARNYGSGDRSLLKKSVASSLIIGVALTALLMAVSRFGLYPILRALHTPEDIIAEAYSYISTILLFSGVLIAYNLCAGLLRAIGNSMMPLVFLVISSVSNIFLDILFITKLDMGIRGAAVATVIAQGLSVVLCLIYIALKCRILVPEKEHFRPDGKLYRELVSQGLSLGAMNAILFSGTVILQGSINRLGELYIACQTTARKINSFFIMPCGTISAATSTFVSQNRGAGNRERIHAGVRTAVKLTVSWGVIATVLMAFFARPLVSLFGSKEAVILDNAALYLRINAPFYAILGVLFIMRHALQAVGDKVRPLFSSVIELVGKILFALLLIPRLGYMGVIICEPVIWCCMCAQLVFSYRKNAYLNEK